MTTRSACSSRSATSCGVRALTVCCSPAAAAACTWPNAPKSTFVNERFIARHMMIERIRPDEPSSAPAMISSLFSSTKPIATAERPAYEFSSEITVGMSAPPIGMISSTPKSSDRHDDDRERPRVIGSMRQVDAGGDRDREQREVDQVLAAIGDRPRRHDLLELAGRHQAAREGEEAEDDLEHDRAGAERRQLAVLEPDQVLGGADQAGGEAAERVRERGPLRDGRERHARERDADRDADERGDRDPREVDDLRVRGACR